MYVKNLPCQSFVTMIPILGLHVYWKGHTAAAGDSFRITKICQWQDLPLQLEKCKKQICKETEKEPTKNSITEATLILMDTRVEWANTTPLVYHHHMRLLH